MLQFIREKITGVFAVIVIVFIGGSLVVSFGNMDAGVGPGDFAVKVNGEDVLMGKISVKPEQYEVNLRQLVAKNSDRIRIIHRNYPMDHKFNPIVKARKRRCWSC